MSTCPKCGKEIPPEANFCPNCGATLEPLEPGPPPKIKKKRPRIAIIIILLVIVVPTIYLLIPKGPNEVIVRITCLYCFDEKGKKKLGAGFWSGVVGTLGQSRSIAGMGNKTYTFTRPSPFSKMVVTAVIQKEDSYYSPIWALLVTIETPEGKILASEYTVVRYGIVTVSWKG